jgi:hypothetical protein
LVDEIPLFEGVIPIIFIVSVMDEHVLVFQDRHLNVSLAALSDSEHDHLLPEVSPRLLPQIVYSILLLFFIEFIPWFELSLSGDKRIMKRKLPSKFIFLLEKTR